MEFPSISQYCQLYRVFPGAGNPEFSRREKPGAGFMCQHDPGQNRGNNTVFRWMWLSEPELYIIECFVARIRQEQPGCHTKVSDQRSHTDGGR